MSTCSSARNLFPTLDNPELTIQRRYRVDPTLLNNFEMAAEGNGDLPVPDLRTMEELCQPSLNGRGGPITSIAIQAMNFRVKNDMIQQVQNSFQFHGLPGDDANKHLDKFLHVTQSIKVNGVTDNALRLNEITNFRQCPDESLFVTWEHYKLLIDRCPNHNMLPVTQIDTFYNGLTLRHRDTINTVAGGTFMKRRPEECYDLIKNITAHHNDWDTLAQRSESSSSITSSFDQEIIALKAEMAEINKNLMNVLQINQQVKAVTPRNQGIPQGNNQGRNLFFQRASHGQNPPPAYQAPGYQGTHPSNTITNPIEDLKGITTRSGNAYQGPTIPTTSFSSPQVVEHETEVTKDIVPPTNNESTKDVQSLVVQVETLITNSEPVVAPVSASKPNQKPSIPYPSRLHDQKLRDKTNDQKEKFFKIFQDLNFNISFVNALILMPKFGSTIKTVRFILDQTLRYSANYNDMTANRIDAIDMACEEYSQEGLSFSDLIASGNPTPYYDPIISSSSPTLTPFGDSDFPLEGVDAFFALEDDSTSPKVDHPYYDPEGDILLLEGFLNDDPSLPPPNQGMYLPQVREELKIYKSKNDKSSIDEPLEVDFKDLPHHLEYTFLQGDDKFPVIIAKDLSVKEKAALIKVSKSHKQAIAWKLSEIKDIDPKYCTHKILMEDDFEPAVQHQRMVNPKIHDVIKKEVLKLLDVGLIYPILDSLGHNFSKNGIEVDNDKVDVIAKLPHPTTVKVSEIINHADPRVPLILERSFLKTGRALIDVYEVELTLRVGSSWISVSGNPTPSTKPIISNSSPTLTPFGDSDFLLEETDAFLAINDEPISPKINDFVEPTNEKSSIDQPHVVELKDLPPHLEYAFLEGDDKLPVIIAKDLKDEEKSALIKVLKSHKQAVVWKLSDIKGINPTFYTYKILMEDDIKPAVQHQRRVNPKIHEVIKKEVLKLLDAGLIYPISDSPWVSPVNYVPKKGGFTIVENEENELIPTRLVTGWREDFSVFGNSFRTCLSHLDKMLKRCEETNLCLNWEKSHFMVKEGIVLGHKISKNGIEVDNAKVDVIAKLPNPTTVKGIRSFLEHKAIDILKACHNGPTGGHHGQNNTAKKVSAIIGPQSIVMPNTWLNLVTLVNVREKFRNGMKYIKIPSKFAIFSMFGASISWGHSRLHKATTTMADNRTMAEMLSAPTEGCAEAIMVPPILAEQFKLKHREARRWLDKEPSCSITTWVDLERYKDLLHACPHHWFTQLHQLDTFYNALNPADQDSLNAAAGGKLLEKSPQDALTIIKKNPSQSANECCDYRMMAMLRLGMLRKFVLPAEVLIHTTSVLPLVATLSHNLGIISKVTFQQPQATTIRMNTASTLGSGSLPSNFVANPKGELKAITTRSCLVTDGPTVPTPLKFVTPEEKLQELAKTPLNENCSAVILKKLPKKLGDPGKFIIPCCFSELKCKALADLGASINLMPLSVWKELESDPRVPIILGRPFLRTARALIDVHGEEMILRDGNERLTLNMKHDTASYSNHPHRESVNLINIFNVSKGCNFLSVKFPNIDSFNDIHPYFDDNPLSGSTTYSSNLLLEDFIDELALITYPLDYDDNLQCDIESDLREIEFLLYQGKDTGLKDLIDQTDLANLDDYFVDPTPEMFTDEHAPDYSSPLRFDVYDC
nr:reverse transcriptase domain-containing protein [Tanacetum cinerariifolium]